MIISIAIIFCIASVQCDPSANSGQSSRYVLGCEAEETGRSVTSCNDVHECGIYTMEIDGMKRKVFCKAGPRNTMFTVIQLRDDFAGEPNDLFFKGWNDYKNGFGDVTQSFWLGLDAIHNLTATPKEMHIEMEDFEGNKRTVTVTGFQVADEDEGYKLSMKRVFPDDLYKGFWFHRDMKFSTKDKDQDTHGINCAKRYKGGWWYRGCLMSNLNGLYLRGPYSSDAIGVNYYGFKGLYYSLKHVEMKVRVR